VKEHNKNFYSLEELKRARDCYEGYQDGEEVFYFVGALRYACEEIERLNNIINEFDKLIEQYSKNDYYYKYNGKYLKSEIINDLKTIRGVDKE